METAAGVIVLIIIAAALAYRYLRKHGHLKKWGLAPKDPPQVKMARGQVVEIPQGDIDIVGESYYQDALASIAGPKCEDGYHLPVTVELRREPKNPHATDGNAVACLINGKKVGYVNHGDSARLQPMLRQFEKDKKKAGVDGYIVGGWSREGGRDEGHYGVKIRFD